ncbi:hypothetical protein F383_21581 [Gossypium arboreum]|uniref:Uncharacterized protein n=1 Tax=Gossypium arboreum TaxID=29729 RepID=A0A0B0NUS1_GOSAR|nr:hypothetical protein F383_21581 [Gossypium arboreum]
MLRPHYKSQCKTMSGTWHRHDRGVSVRPCLGHGISTDM